MYDAQICNDLAQMQIWMLKTLNDLEAWNIPLHMHVLSSSSKNDTADSSIDHYNIVLKESRGNEVADRLARRGATGVDSNEEASPEDQFTIPKEDLVVTAVLGTKDVTRLVALDGLGGVLRDGKGPRAKREIGEVRWTEGGQGDQSEEVEAEDAPT